MRNDTNVFVDFGRTRNHRHVDAVAIREPGDAFRPSVEIGGRYQIANAAVGTQAHEPERAIPTFGRSGRSDGRLQRLAAKAYVADEAQQKSPSGETNTCGRAPSQLATHASRSAVGVALIAGTTALAVGAALAPGAALEGASMRGSASRSGGATTTVAWGEIGEHAAQAAAAIRIKHRKRTVEPPPPGSRRRR